MMKNNTRETKNAQTDAKFQVTGNWESQAKHLKEKYAQLTDADLKFETGKEDELLTRLENRLAKKREEVITMLTKEQSKITN